MDNFNPRPLAGATDLKKVLAWVHCQFQSTPPCGGDIERQEVRQGRLISIHAPLRGRLLKRYGVVVACRISIHAPLRGRLGEIVERYGIIIFQSTPPCGGDCWVGFISLIKSYFNPRPLAGATIPDEMRELFDAISIHAPLRGRLMGADNPDALRDFNPRPLAGATAIGAGS